jgi:hypothetical protein
VTDRDAAQTPPWHSVAVDETIRRLKSDPAEGLARDEADRRLAKYGPNRLPEGSKRGPLMRFLLQFDNVLVYVLLAAGFIKLMLGLWLDASIITGVVVINALLGFIQEGKAEKALDSIRNMLSSEARTLRDGETRVVAAEELVPGDVVLLESGDRIPADIRLIEVKNLRTDEAALTGESVPADKSTDPTPENSTVGDRENMAFSGTLVVSGRAVGIVVGTGAATELGRINQMLATVNVLETPLLRQIKQFGHTIAKVIGVISVLIFAYGRWVRDLPFVEAFQAVVGIAVSVIPEGLPALITITMAIAAQRHHPQASRSGDARIGIANLFRQDRHVDAHGNDGRFGGQRNFSLSRHGRRLCERRRGAARRRAGGPKRCPQAHGHGFRALQRLRAAPFGRRVEGRRRSHRGGALSLRRQTGVRPASRKSGAAQDRRHTL